MRRLMFVVALLCVLSLGSIAQARQPYPEYWNGDRNFPLVWGHDGTAFYIDRSSIEISRRSDTVLVAAINVLSVDERGTEYRSNVTGKKFHGARKWRREKSNEYLTVFDNVFYARY